MSTSEYTEPKNPWPAPEAEPAPKRLKTIVVGVVSLPVELGKAALGGLIVGMGTFVGALTVTTASNTTSLKAAGIGAGFTFITFFANSLNNWYQQQGGASI